MFCILIVSFTVFVFSVRKIRPNCFASVYFSIQRQTDAVSFMTVELALIFCL